MHASLFRCCCWLLGIAAPVLMAVDATAADQTLTLEEALTVAFERSPVLRAQLAEVDEARGRRKAARTIAFNPELELEAAQIGDGTEAIVALGQELEIAGQRRKRATAASEDLRAASALFVRNQRQLASDVRLAFVDALEARDLLAIAKSDQELLETLQELTQRRKRKGAASQLEANVAAIELGRARASVHRAQAAYDEARSALAAVLGLDPSDPPIPTGDLIVELSAPPRLAELLEGKGRRADLTALSHLGKAARAQIKVARAERVPNVAIQAFGGAEDGAQVAGAGVSIPLPAFNRNQGQVAEARATTRRVEAEYAAAVLAARQEIVAAHARYEAARTSLRLLQESVVGTLEQNLILLQRMFETGRTSWTDVTQIRRSLIEARGEIVETAAGARRSRVQLDLAAGRTAVPATTPREGTP